MELVFVCGPGRLFPLDSAARRGENRTETGRPRRFLSFLARSGRPGSILLTWQGPSLPG